MVYRLKSYEEYEEKVRELLRTGKYPFPGEYVEEFIQRGDVRTQYEHEIEESKLFGEDRLNPGGLASCCWMLYPEFPDVPPVEPSKSVIAFE